jgi:hypothetical protein
MHSACLQHELVWTNSRRPTLRKPVLAILLLLVVACPSSAQETLGALHKAFADPPDDCRIMMRWWWFGPAVSKPEIQRELQEMKSGGIGGVEIATPYPQSLDDPVTGFHNAPYLSDEHLDALRFAAQQAARLGLRVDVTLGSGWPFGGPHIPITQAAGELRVETILVPPGAESVAVPSIGAGEQLLRAFLVPGAANAMHLPEASAATDIRAGRLITGTPEQSERTALFFIASRTGMMVKRPAVGAEGFVLDHYNQRAIATTRGGGISAAVRICRSSALCRLQRQPRGLRFGLDAGLSRGVSHSPRLRHRSLPASPDRR